MSDFSYGNVAKAICGRCSCRFRYFELAADPNSPELRVCRECRDQFDPYRLAARKIDPFVLRKPRPDVPLDDIPNYILDSAGNAISTEAGNPILDTP